jgi:hypothetical protein
MGKNRAVALARKEGSNVSSIMGLVRVVFLATVISIGIGVLLAIIMLMARDLYSRYYKHEQRVLYSQVYGYGQRRSIKAWAELTGQDYENGQLVQCSHYYLHD